MQQRPENLFFSAFFVTLLYHYFRPILVLFHAFISLIINDRIFCNVSNCSKCLSSKAGAEFDNELNSITDGSGTKCTLDPFLNGRAERKKSCAPSNDKRFKTINP